MSFPSPAGMSLTKLPLGRNNSVMTSLFPPEFGSDIRLGTGNSRTFFLRCNLSTVGGISFINGKLYHKMLALKKRDFTNY
jgi:hypothetical protein